MKKLIKSALFVLLATSLLTSFVACSSDDDPFAEASGQNNDGNGENGGSVSWDDAEEISSLVDAVANWEKSAAEVPTTYTSRLQSGSYVLFTVENGSEGYCKFHADNGSWGACGVEKYYTLTGEAISVEEDNDNAGVYNGEGEGSYYFAVTDENLATLKQGFTLRGHFTLKKIGMTNLADGGTGGGTKDEARIVSGDKITLTVGDNASSVSDTTPAKVILQYDSANRDETAITITDAELKIWKNGCLLDRITTIKGFTLNVWGGTGSAFSEDATITDNKLADADTKTYKLDILLEGLKVEKDDKISIQLVSGTVNGTCANSLKDNLRATIGAGDDSLNGWKFESIVTSDTTK